MDVSGLLARFGEVSPQGDGWLAFCPAHADSRASLRLAVTPDGTGLVKCRAGCDTAAVLSAVGLTFGDLRGIDVSGEVTMSAQPSLPLSPGSIAALRVQLDHYSGVSDAAAEYAWRRFGVDRETADRLGLGSTVELPGGERLVVPFCDPDGVALGFQARALDPHAAVRWFGPKNPEQGSWSRVGFFHGGSTADQVLVTEGPGDALAVAAAGFDAIAVRGAALAGSVADTIAQWADGRTIVLAGDGDAAGRNFNASLSSLLIERGCTVGVLEQPDGQDLADRVQAVGADEFRRFLIGAVASVESVGSLEAALMERDEDRFPLTDLGNARFVADLAAREGTPLRYVEEIGFLIYTGGVWGEDHLDRSRALVHRSADRVREIARQIAKAVGNDPNHAGLVARWAKWADYVQSKRGIDAVLSELVALPDVATRIDALDTHHHLLAVRNGVVNLRTGQLQEHNPELLLTKRLDLDFDPDAKAARWEQYLDEVMRGDQSMVDYLQRLVGYSITGETSEQCFTVLWGSGANGKTVFTATLNDIFGPISETTPFATFESKPSGGIPNDLAALRAARMVFASEGDADRPMDESLLKRVTGRDPVTARFLRKEFFTFQPRFQIFLATNNKPAFRGADEGLWRRVKLIEWARYFAPDERDAGIFDALLGEAEGILAWAVRGAEQWYRTGLDDPPAIVAATREYRDTSDYLSGFLPGVYVHDPNASRVLGKTIFDDYLSWAADENLKQSEVVTRRRFFAMLEERGFVKHTVKEGVAFRELRRARPSDWTEGQ